MAKNVLVVGGNSGIGLATVKHLQAAGHQVTVWSRKSDLVDGLGVDFFPCDVTEGNLPDAPEGLQAVVYCPGTITLKPFHRLQEKDFLADFQVNALGAVRVLQQVLPQLKKSGDASVVMFSTVAVQLGLPFHASIAAAKGAVEGLVRSLAAELAPGIRVNALAPSLTDTPLAGPLLGSEEKREAAANRHPLKAVGHPEQVAGLVEMLLTEPGNFMTGQIIGVDGGLGAVKLF